jgi:hypothetical protein
MDSVKEGLGGGRVPPRTAPDLVEKSGYQGTHDPGRPTNLMGSQQTPLVPVAQTQLPLAPADGSGAAGTPGQPEHR